MASSYEEKEGKNSRELRALGERELTDVLDTSQHKAYTLRVPLARVTMNTKKNVIVEVYREVVMCTVLKYSELVEDGNVF